MLRTPLLKKSSGVFALKGGKMRIKKPYSDEFKKEIAKKYFNGEKAKDLAEQYALSSGVQLVYL